MKPFHLMTKHLLIVATFFITSISVAQLTTKSDTYKSKVTDPNANFFELVAQKRAEFALMDLSNRDNKKAYKQFERWAYIWRDKINANGSFPTQDNNRSSKETFINLLLETQQQNRIANTNAWTQIGPIDRPAENNYTGYPGKGRINVIAEDPTNTDIMYAGSAAGGVWKTTNNGVLWTPKSDFLAGLGVTDILVDPNNTDIVYIATGDEDGEHISSIGVFKSIDAGETWNPTGLTFGLEENEFIRDLEFAPGSSTKIFALTNTDVKVTTDSGTTWNNVVVPAVTFTEKFQSIVFDPNDPNKVILSDFYDAIYVSIDGGATFETHDVFEGENDKKLLKLTTTANDLDHFYGLSQDGEFRKYRFAIDYTSADLVSTTTIAGFSSQEGYDQCLAISPTNKNHIVVAGVNGYRSTNGGTTFSTLLNAYDSPPGAGFYVHADHHHLSFLADGVTVLNGHDGGIHKGPFNATSTTPWDDLSNTLIITQPYNIAVTQETNGDNFMMANQDNDGFSRILKDGTRQWVSCLAGDGTSTAIDISDSNIRYLGGTNGSLGVSYDGFSISYDSYDEILPSSTTAAFVSPMALHPTTAETIYACHGDIKKSTNRGVSWTALNSGISETNFIEVVSNGTSVKIFTINEEGTARLSVNDGATWTTVTPPTGQLFNSFSALPNTNIVYATVRGYEAGKKVYKSTNNGSSWTNISDGLPNIIMKKVKLNTMLTNETLYLGTELGPYIKDNSSANWTKLGTGLPNVRVDDLDINYTDQKLYIGTFGRGLWEIAIEARCTGITKTWDGSSWTPSGIPNSTDIAVINGNYNTDTDGSIDACSLIISGTSIVNVAAETYISLQNSATIETNATLNVLHQGSFVQVEDDATVINNGSINVMVTTPSLDEREFMILGSPMTATSETVFNSAYQVLNHDTDSYEMYTTNSIDGINFYDQEGDDLSYYTGLLNPAEGYIVRPSYTDSGIYNYTFDGGTLNSGEINYTAGFNNTNKDDSANFLSNPYPSAIDANLFLSENSGIISELYFWEHLTPPGVMNGPYGEQNFSMEDISTYNNMGGTAPAANGGTTPTNIIATAQGFGIKANAGGTIKFTNAMRVSSGNTTLRSSLEDANRLWFSVRETQSDKGSSNLIGFTSAASEGFDYGFDTKKIGTEVSLYTHLQDGTEQLSIQSREAFNDEMSISMGFSTLLDEELSYTISSLDKEGDLISNATVYLIDNLVGTTTNMNEENYTFTSTAGTFNNRFIIIFQNNPLGVDDVTLSSISIYPNPADGIINVNSPHAIISNIEIIDVRGRILEKINTDKLNNIQVDLSSYGNAIYFVKVTTENGIKTKRVIKN